MAETESTHSASLLGHLRGAEGDRLTEPSEGRKLPQIEPRALATPTEIESFSQRGASGGMQEGPRKGCSPIIGPTLPHAAQASQTSPNGEIPCPKGSKYYTPPAKKAKPHAAQAAHLAISLKNAHYSASLKNRPWRNCSWPVCVL